MEPIPVHRRRILDARGIETVEEVVDCPRDGRIRLVLACSSCGYACGVGYDERLEKDAVDCTQAIGEPCADRAALSRGASIQTLREIQVVDVCARDVFCAMPDTPIAAVRRVLLEHAIGVVVVVSPSRAPVGVISATDLVRAPDAKRVADAMTAHPLTAPLGMSLAQAAAVMAFEGVRHLPVVGPGGRLVGLLSTVDLLRALARASGAIIPDRTARRIETDRVAG